MERSWDKLTGVSLSQPIHQTLKKLNFKKTTPVQVSHSTFVKIWHYVWLHGDGEIPVDFELIIYCISKFYCDLKWPCLLFFSGSLHSSLNSEKGCMCWSSDWKWKNFSIPHSHTWNPHSKNRTTEKAWNWGFDYLPHQRVGITNTRGVEPVFSQPPPVQSQVNDRRSYIHISGHKRIHRKWGPHHYYNSREVCGSADTAVW